MLRTCLSLPLVIPRAPTSVFEDQCIKKQRHHFADKGPYSQIYGFSSSHVRMWELNHKEDWAPTNWCFWTVVLEKTPESPLDSKEIKPVNPKGNQPWIFIGRTDAEALIFWPPDTKSHLIGKDPDAGKGKRRRGWQRMRWLDSITDSVNINLSKLWEAVKDRKPGVLQSIGLQRVGNNRMTKQQQ